MAAAALLASCGSGIGASGSDNALTEAEKSRIAEQWRDCMAEGGLEADVQYDGGGLDISVGGGPDVDDAQMMEIEAGCEPILEGLENDSAPDLTPEEQAQFEDGIVEVEKCMLDAGYVVRVDDEGLSVNSEDQPEGYDEAALEETEAACWEAAVPELWAKYGEGSE